MTSSPPYSNLPSFGRISARVNVAVVIIALLIIGDSVSGLLFNLGIGFHRVGLIIKSIVTVFTLIFYLPMIRNRSFRSIYLCMAILVVVWMVAATISYFTNPAFELGYSVVVLNRYFFFLILATMFMYAGESDGFDKSCRTVLDTFFVVNNTLIVVGLVFGIYWLSSFDPTNEWGGNVRFGYKGLIFGNNEIAGIYAIGVAYYFREQFKMGRSSVVMLIFTCVAAVLTGAKAGVLAVILIGGYYLIRYRVNYLLLLVIPSLLGLGYLLVKYWDFIVEKYLFYTVNLFERLDLVSFLTSGRNKYLIANFRHIGNNWNVLNYVVGDAFLYSETDFFDLYYFFGLGGALYFYIYTKIFFRRDRSVDNHYFFLVLMSLAFIAGHVIQSAIVPLFVLLYVYSVKGIRNPAIR